MTYLTRSFSNSLLQRDPAQRQKSPRKGAVTVWVIIALPVMILFFLIILEIANVWLARVELENSLEASALAAVKKWGDQAGAAAPYWTTSARNRGVLLAGVNKIRGVNTEIGRNRGIFDSSTNPNENRASQRGTSDLDPSTSAPHGNLVFGAVSDELINGQLVTTFDASKAPACSPCKMTIEAKGNQDDLSTCDGDLSRGWTICFDDCFQNTTVKKIIFDINLGTNPPPGMGAKFQDSTSSPSFCANPVPTHSFSNNDRRLTMSFNPPLDPAQFPCNSPYEFGLGITGFGQFGNQGCNTMGNNADQLGAAGVFVHVVFDVNGVEVTASTTFQVGDRCDLMSFAILDGNGLDFGVRAQARVRVPSLCGRFAGIDFGPFFVSAKTTARYKCTTNRVRLIHVDRFICQPGRGADEIGGDHDDDDEP